MEKWCRRHAAIGMCILLCVLVLAGCGSSLVGKQEDVQSGDHIELGSLVLSIQNHEVTQEVAPDHPEGYYDYYQPHEGYVYYTVSGQASNSGDTDIDSGNVITQAVVEGKTTEAKLLFLNENGSAFTDVLKTGETRSFKLFLIQKTQQRAPEEFVFYYNQGFQAEAESNTYDYQTTLRVDGK